MLDVRLLGQPEVTVDGAPLEVDTRKAVALLSYLVVEGSAARDFLATLLWSESSADRARATLRRTLSSLRNGVGPDAVTSDRNRVGVTRSVSSDVASFDAELAATSDHGHDHTGVCSTCIPFLARATALYRGDFLQGFSVRDAPEFEDWVRTTAEHLRVRAGDAFQRLSMARASIGDYGGALAAVSRWIDLDDLHEPAHRLSMLLHAWSGDRPGAIEAFRRCVGVLDEELGVAPLEETTELYEAILDEDLPPAPGVRRRVKVEAAQWPDKTADFLNRELELEQLRDAFDSLSDNGLVVVIEGGPWMGKTRMLEDFLTDAEGSAQGSVLVRCSRTEQTLPYSAAIQMIQYLAPTIELLIDEIPDWAGAEAARLTSPVGSGDEGYIDHLGELRLLEGLHEIIRVLSGHGLMVIGVDDAQWIDNASGRLFAYLAKRLDGLRLLLILNVRTGEPPVPPIQEALRLAKTLMRLAPLSSKALDGLIEDSGRAESIIQGTGGIPLLVAEALREGDGEEVTATIGRYVDERLRGLSDLARQVVTAASVLAGAQDSSLLRETSGRTEEELVQAVEELISAGLLRDVPNGDGFRFALDAVETMVYESASLIRKRLLHRRAAQALESRPRANTDARLAGEVAAHYRGAGDPEAAFWYRLAGDLARDVYANTEARVLYETAIALGAEAVDELRLGLGELAIAEGDYPRASRELRAAASHATGEQLALAEHRLGEVQRLLGRFSLAEEHFERATKGHPDAASLFSDWALLHHRRGKGKKAMAAAQKALNLAERQRDQAAVARALNILAVVTADPVEAMGHIDKALDMAADNELARMAALNNKGHLLGAIGNLDAAGRLVEEAIGIASKTGHRHREAALRNHLADLHHRAGRPDLADMAMKDAVVLFADVDVGLSEPEVWFLSQW